MCVIITKDAGVKMPSYNIIRAAWQRNPDGGGFATPTKHFHSMDFDEFYKELSKVKKSEPCIIHLRWATHGSVCLSNCHPFFSDVNGGVWFCHNGILSVKPMGNMTDSETAFRRFIVPTIQRFGFHSDELDDMVESLIGGSKFAFLTEGEITRFGDYRCINGVYYSNTHWLTFLSTNRYQLAV